MKISQLLAIPLLAAIAIPSAAQASVETAIAQFQMSSTKAPVAQRSTDADLAKTLYEDFAEIERRPCDGYRKTITDGFTKYTVCATKIGGGSRFGSQFISSASSANIEAGDGILYRYHYNGKVAAIAFSHDGRLFMFDRGGKLQAELMRDQKRSVTTKFNQRDRDRLEKLAKGGGKEILSKFK